MLWNEEIGENNEIDGPGLFMAIKMLTESERRSEVIYSWTSLPHRVLWG